MYGKVYKVPNFLGIGVCYRLVILFMSASARLDTWGCARVWFPPKENVATL